MLAAAATSVLAGCGGGPPHMARADAAPLIGLAHRIPGEASCAQARDIRALQARAAVLVKAHRIPARLQGPLISGVHLLRAQMPICLPPVEQTAPPPPVSSPAPPPPSHGAGKPHGHGHGHGHEKGGKG